MCDQDLELILASVAQIAHKQRRGCESERRSFQNARLNWTYRIRHARGRRCDEAQHPLSAAVELLV